MSDLRGKDRFASKIALHVQGVEDGPGYVAQGYRKVRQAQGPAFADGFDQEQRDSPIPPIRAVVGVARGGLGSARKGRVGQERLDRERAAAAVIAHDEDQTAVVDPDLVQALEVSVDP